MVLGIFGLEAKLGLGAKWEHYSGFNSFVECLFMYLGPRKRHKEQGTGKDCPDRPKARLLTAMTFKILNFLPTNQSNKGVDGLLP